MALATIQDFLHDWPGWATLATDDGDAALVLASGEVRVWELRGRLWALSVSSVKLRPSVLAKWQAVIESLENGKQLFWGYDMSRRYPILYPRGSWPTGGAFSGLNAAVASINANRKAMTVDGLPVGYVISIGDMLQVTHDNGSVTLIRAAEAATANGSGLTPEFEFRPHLDAAAAVDDVVAVKRPACKMAIVPGSVRPAVDPETGRGAISFSAMEYNE